jgi:uncharacterized membrane protein
LTSQLKLAYFPVVSATEIIEQLPKLSDAERRAIREVLLELANKNEDIAACNQAAMEGAMMLDQMEKISKAMATRLGI